MKTAATPVADAQRIRPLDTLRGFAILGILMMNIQSFSMPIAAYLNPTAYGDLNGINWVAWLISHILADRKFITIFSMLFGAGIVLFCDRAEAKGRRARGLHYRRMLFLLLLGMGHAYGLWYGDILVAYALCGMLVYPMRRLSPRVLAACGLALVAVGSLIYLFFGLTMPYWPPEAVSNLEHDVWRPTAEHIALELAAYRGGWWAQMEHRIPEAIMLQTQHFLTYELWRAGGLMLIGMALFRWGVMSGQRSARFYRLSVLAAIGVGLPVVLYGVARNAASGWDVHYSFFLGGLWNSWASVLIALGWIGVVMLACQAGVLAGLRARLSAVGQTAFSNYILQTVIGMLLFYGCGAGLYGHVSRAGQLAMVPAIWALQLVISPIWLRHFRFGPLEWLWRSLTYGEAQPMRRQFATTPP